MKGNAGMVHVIILVGVSGSGKTSVGKGLAERLGYAFYDADDFHSEINVNKMAEGKALTDVDRFPWLQILARLISENIESNKDMILACSALKPVYRDVLAQGNSQVKFILLEPSYETLQMRMRRRRGHFMPESLLDSQIETLSYEASHFFMHLHGEAAEMSVPEIVEFICDSI